MFLFALRNYFDYFNFCYILFSFKKCHNQKNIRINSVSDNNLI